MLKLHRIHRIVSKTGVCKKTVGVKWVYYRGSVYRGKKSFADDPVHPVF